MSVQVVGLGTVVVDHQMVLPHFPSVDSKNEASSERIQVGGPVPTALALLSRFGRSTTFLGTWGADAWGRLIEDDFACAGINSPHLVRRDAVRTGVAHVWIDERNGSRTVAYRRCNVHLSVDDLDLELLRSCRALHLDGWPEEAALAAARHVRDAGGLVCLDTGTPKPGLRRLLQYVDVVNCPSHFPREFLGNSDHDAAGRLLTALGPRIVTITNGAAGATLFTSAQRISCPAIPVMPIDTTGAGDVFSGALLHAVLEGWTAERMLSFAVAAAGLKCRGMGNRESLPSLAEIEQHVSG